MDFSNASTPGNFCESATVKTLLAQIEGFKDPFRREPNTRIFLTALYTTVACVGAIGNLLVIAAVVKNPQMRTPRNYFIINLALSDLLMCTLTVPFTLYYVLNTFWALGSTACKIVASVQGVNIFVSTMSITAIGFDRYWVILFPTKTQQQRLVIGLCFTFIWIFSCLLAFPLVYATDTTSLFRLDMLAVCGVKLLVCNENWDQMAFDKRVYTISSEAFQYVLPLTMLTFVYTRIIWRLENRMVYRQRAVVSQFENSAVGIASGTQAANRLQNRRRSLEVRQRRMNLLLICVVAFFAFCWLPLNVYNALMAFEVTQYNVVAFSSCHVFGMISACVNPLLYGVFNENFRHEFVAILTWLRIVPVLRYIRKSTRRTAHNCDVDVNEATTTAPIKNGRSHGSRRNGNRANRVTDGFQKYLDIPHPRPSASITTANGYYCNISSAGTGTHCYTSSPPSRIDDFESTVGNGRVDCATPKKKFDQLAVGESTPEENTPLVSDSGCIMSDKETFLKSYVITTDL